MCVDSEHFKPIGLLATARLDVCISHCKEIGYTYALIQDSRMCSCSDWVDDWLEAPPINCQSKISVYSTCPWGSYGLDCRLPCPGECKNHNQTTTGVCHITTGTCGQGCKLGWTGSMCTLQPNCYSITGSRDLSSTSNNPHLSINEAVNQSYTETNISAGLYIFPWLIVPNNSYVRNIVTNEDFVYVTFWDISPPLNETLTTRYVATLVNSIEVRQGSANDLEQSFVHKGSVVGLYYPRDTLANQTTEAETLPQTLVADWSAVSDLSLLYGIKVNVSKLSHDLPIPTPSFTVYFTCELGCPNGHYGDTCQSLCLGCSSNLTCHPALGICPESRTNISTSTVITTTTSSWNYHSQNSTSATIGMSVGIVIALAILVAMVIGCSLWEKRKRQKQEIPQRMYESRGSIETGTRVVRVPWRYRKSMDKESV